LIVGGTENYVHLLLSLPADMPLAKTMQMIAYIQAQAEHHRKRSFEEEFIVFLKKNNVDYDPRYVWG